MNNRGFEPTQGDRDTLTYQLACDLRHICGRNFDWLDQVIPCYDGFPLEEKRAKIKSALALHLKEKLETYKVPQLYEQVTTIHRTFNGKLNRKAYQE